MKTIPALLMAFAISYSAIPSGMLFQGSFAEDGSSATKSITVKVCDAPVDGNCHTAFTGDVTTVRNHFAVTLNTSVMDFTKSLYLETIVNSVLQGERIPLTAAPYAHHSLFADSAQKAETADYATTAGTASVATTATNATNATYATNATNAVYAQEAERIPLIQSSGNTTTMEARNIQLADTVVMKSEMSIPGHVSTNYRGMISNGVDAFQWMRAELESNPVTTYSDIKVSHDSVSLTSTYDVIGYPSMKSNLTITPNKIQLATDTVLATQTESGSQNQFLKTDAIQLVRKQPFGYMGGANIEDCTEKILGTIMLQAAPATGVNTLLICMFNGSLSNGDKYRWYPITLGNYYDF